MKGFWKRFVRRTYRTLRRPKYRAKSGIRFWLASRVFHRSLWHPEAHAMSLGLGIGLAVAMLPPVPIQMLVAAMLAVLCRANIPIAAAAVWVSNPATWYSILNFQRDLGRKLLPAKSESAESGLGLSLEVVRSVTLGVLITATVLGLTGYAVMALCCRIFRSRSAGGVNPARVRPRPDL